MWTNIPHLKILIFKMFEYAGLDATDVDFTAKEWFMDYTWTDKQERKYKEWFINYLVANIKARKEVMKMPSMKSREYLEKFFDHFNLMYGLREQIKGNIGSD